MTTLKQNMLEFMKFGFATQNLEIVRRRNRTNAVAVWRRCIRDKSFSHAIGGLECVGMWDDTPQGYEYWSIMMHRIMGGS